MKDIDLPPLPERDTSKPAEEQGVFRKFDVRRTDGSSEPGGKHHGCEYFVLDVDHDPAASAALAAYADAIEATHPVLAADMRSRYGLARAAVEADRAQRVPGGDGDLLTIAYLHGFAKGKDAALAPTPAPAQQEPDWKDMYEKEKRRSAMWIAKYEKDIGPLECAGPVSHQEPSPQERKPMTPEQVAETVFEVNGNEPSALFWRDLVSAVERHHGIKE